MVSVAQSLAEAALDIEREIEIKAPIEKAFQALLDTMGPKNETPDGVSMQMVIEPYPGGRWYRDLGNNSGHLWGHVQVIKPPTLIEITGSMFMSYAAISHIQYKLTEDSPSRTRLALHHTAVGLINPEHREGVKTGWNFMLERMRANAEG